MASLLTLRRAINKLGILERAGSAWKTLHCVIIGIVGDGNCLFRALSVHLAGTEKGHKAVRSLVFEHLSLMSNEDLLKFGKRHGLL